MHLYDPRQQTEDELGATRYTINENRGEKSTSIQCDLCYLTGRRMLSLSDASLIRELQQSCYGNLLPATFETNNPMPFNPIHEIKEALKREGYSPRVKVPANLLPPLPKKDAKKSTSANPIPERDVIVIDPDEEARNDDEMNVEYSSSPEDSDSDEEMEEIEC